MHIRPVSCIEDIQVLGMNMAFISLNEVENLDISLLETGT